MGMIFLIFCTAFAMEAIGTYISVVGLGSLFAGDPVILTMAVILDVAKITSVSFLYQYWVTIKAAMKYYLLAAAIVLMTITSAGAFGYLSGAFQKALAPNMAITLKVDSYNRERDQLVAERTELIKQRANIDAQVAGVKSDDVDVKRRLMRSFKPESERISQRLIVVTKRVDELNDIVLKVESENIDSRVHAGPITYISKAFNISVEEASKWIILTIIFVFDPLAIMLILAGNFLVKKRKDEQLHPHIEPQKPEPTPEPPKAEVPKLEHEEPSVVPVELPKVEPQISYATDVLEPTEVMDVEPHEVAPTEEAVINSTELTAPVDVSSLWGLDKTATYGELPEQVSTSWQLPEPVKAEELEPIKSEELDLFEKMYDSFDTGEHPIDDNIPDDLIEPSDIYEHAVEDYVPTVPEDKPAQVVEEPVIEPVIDVVPEVHESSPQTELIDEVPHGLNVKELIAAAKKRVSKKKNTAKTEVETKAESKEEKPEESPKMVSSLESLKIGTSGAMIGGGHPASHTRGIYE